MKRVIVFCDYIEANTIAKVLKITMIIIISWKIIRYYNRFPTCNVPVLNEKLIDVTLN